MKQAEDPFPKITPELLDKLNANMDMTWPHDPAVPDLPPMPVTDDPKHDPNAFLWTHFNDNIYPPKVLGVPERQSRIVTEDDPLEVDVYWSMRSPYRLPGVKPPRMAELQLQRQREHSARLAGGCSLDQGRQRQSRGTVWHYVQGAGFGLGYQASRKVFGRSVPISGARPDLAGLAA